MTNLKSGLRGVEATEGSVSTADQTTIRVPKRIQEQLKVIAALEQRTIFAVTESVLADYIRRYESAIGRPVLNRAKETTPDH